MRLVQKKTTSKKTTHKYVLNYQCDDYNYHLSAIFAWEEGLYCVNKNKKFALHRGYIVFFYSKNEKINFFSERNINAFIFDFKILANKKHQLSSRHGISKRSTSF